MEYNLNPVQYEAVLHGDGPLLVSAGAGSGKTRVLTCRIAHLISDCGVRPWEILAVTFTNKAAKEMLERVIRLVGPVAESMWVRTFHSSCARILRFNAELLDFHKDFSIYDQADSLRLTRSVMSDLNIANPKPRGFHGRISTAKNAMIGPYEYEVTAEDYLERQTAKVYSEYQKRLAAAAAMDFDDLLLMTLRLFNEHPDVLENYQDRFCHILVDEYQDTNKPQNELVLKLGAKHRNVFVVGDSDQSIYGFRGAVLSNIQEFDAAFEDASVILLEQNYRSTQNVLSVANSVISFNSDRLPKELWSEKDAGEPVRWFQAYDETEEANWMAEEIRRLITEENYRLGDIAVMYRVNVQSRAAESALVAAGLSYEVIGAASFYERKEIRDALSYLRVLLNPTDEVSLRRVINVPRRGVGEKSLQRLSDWAAEHGLTFSHALPSAAEAGVSAGARRGIEDFLTLMEDARDRLEEGPADVIEFLLTKSGYLGELSDEAEDDIIAAGRLENIEELLGTAAEFDATGDFLEQAALVSSADLVTSPAEQAVSDPKVQIMTVHASKGLEFPVVFLLGMEDGLFPISRAVDVPSELSEERRLAYVAVTRAQERLYFSSAQRRRLWSDTQFNPPSRFLEELPSDLLLEEASPSLSSYGGYGGYGGSNYSHYGRSGTGRAPTAAERRERWKSREVERSVSSSRDLQSDSRPPAGLSAEDLKVGSDVRHPRWGEGVVIDIDELNGEAEATVTFPDVGEKRLLLAWARLTKVD